MAGGRCGVGVVRQLLGTGQVGKWDSEVELVAPPFHRQLRPVPANHSFGLILLFDRGDTFYLVSKWEEVLRFLLHFLAFSCSFGVGEKSMMKCQLGRWVSVYSTYVRPQRLLHSGTLVTCSLAPLAGNEKVYRKWTFFPKNVYSFLFSICLTNTRSFDVVYLGDVCWVHTSASHPCVFAVWCEKIQN